MQISLIEDIPEMMIMLIQERERIGMSQRQLAEIAGIHQTTLSKFERGSAVPSFTQMVCLAGALGVNVRILAAFQVVPAFDSPV